MLIVGVLTVAGVDCRGVGMAVKMPSRALKKECAAILESMKVPHFTSTLLSF